MQGKYKFAGKRVGECVPGDPTVMIKWVYM